MTDREHDDSLADTHQRRKLWAPEARAVTFVANSSGWASRLLVVEFFEALRVRDSIFADDPFVLRAFGLPAYLAGGQFARHVLDNATPDLL
jgi:hypothetical protein